MLNDHLADLAAEAVPEAYHGAAFGAGSTSGRGGGSLLGSRSSGSLRRRRGGARGGLIGRRALPQAATSSDNINRAVNERISLSIFLSLSLLL
ncbi:hypothetical protein HC891_13915 [Candidatus Gracilibacteria bacterium]|nr:hypothetical protein [Candidatus Gracilibacteria bacterium]